MGSTGFVEERKESRGLERRERGWVESREKRVRASMLLFFR